MADAGVQTDARDVGDAEAAAGEDAAATTDGGRPTVVRPDDLLIIDPGHLQVVQGWRRCVSASLRHSDGTVDRITPADVTLAIAGEGAALVALGEPRDCDPNPHQFAILGMQAGEGPIEVRLGTARFAMRAEVLAAPVRAERFGNPITVGVGQATEVNWSVFQHRAYDGTQEISAGVALARWAALESVDPTIFEVERIDHQRYRLVGRRQGATRLRSRYEGPTVSFESETLDVDVVSAGVLSSVRSEWREPGASDRVFSVSVGDCFDAVLLGSYRADGRQYEAVVDAPTWSASGLRAEGEGRYCVESSGEVSLRGCAGSYCTTSHAFVPSMEVRSVSIEARSAPPFDTGPGSPFRMCPPLGIRLEYVDGSSVDLTASPAATLRAVVPVSTPEGLREEYWFEETSAAGATVFQGMFRCLSGTGNRPVGRAVSVDFVGTVAGRTTAARFDVAFP